jgi:hypothetical protein
MRPRILYALLLLPNMAHAQFSLVARQVGPGGPADDTYYHGICAKDACRATLLVYVDNVPCVLNARVSAPNKFGGGVIKLATGPCRGGFEIEVSPGTGVASYALDQFGAAVETLRLQFQPRTNSGEGDFLACMNDGVVRPGTSVELEIIATKPR